MLPAGSPIVARFEPVNLPVSQDSSVLLSPNRVRQDLYVTREDQYPSSDTSPISDDHLSTVSPATSRGSSPVASEWDAESIHSAGVSPATSALLSITHRTADIQILTPPPAPHPLRIQLNTDPSLLVQLATAYREWLPQHYFPSTVVHDAAWSRTCSLSSGPPLCRVPYM